MNNETTDDTASPTRYQVIVGRYPFECLTITHWTED